MNQERTGRTIKMYHGVRLWRRYTKKDENGNTILDENGEVQFWKKPQPSGGVRIVNISPLAHRLSVREIIDNYGGSPYKEEEWKEEKVEPYRGKISLNKQTTKKKVVNMKTKKYNPKKKGRVRKLKGGDIRSINNKNRA